MWLLLAEEGDAGSSTAEGERVSALMSSRLGNNVSDDVGRGGEEGGKHTWLLSGANLRNCH